MRTSDLRSAARRVKQRMARVMADLLAFPALLTGALRRTAARSSDKERWKRVAGETLLWDERNAIIGRLIRPGESVLDLGCGMQTLRQHMPENCSYQPCDLVPRTPDTLVCDFNQGEFPSLTGHYDVVVCSGLLEYLEDPRTFVDRISRIGSRLILSYRPHDGRWRGWIQRLADGHVNHLQRRELEAMLQSAGCQTARVYPWADQLIYELLPVPQGAAPRV